MAFELQISHPSDVEADDGRLAEGDDSVIRTDEEARLAELLDGLRAGRPAAYETLLEQFEAPLYRFFYYSHGDHELAEDQCGETFANLITAVHKMRGEAASLRAFVFGVARNVMRRGWRQKKVYQIDPLVMDGLADRQPTAYRLAADRQEFDRAMEAIERFPDPARQILLLRFVEELSLAEIATALDLPVGTVKSYIHRCRKRLRMILGMP